MEQKIVVEEKSKGIRLDKFLTAKISWLSRAKISNLINQGLVRVEGKIKKPSFHLDSGQKVTLTLIEEKKELKPFDFAVKIVYEDDDIIVVDKPGGLVVHPPQAGYSRTLVNALISLKKELAKIEPLRPGVVHRLDKETSGIMILAKNKQSYQDLVRQFKERKIEKEYRAIVWGQIKKKDLVVDLPLARDKKNRLKMKISFIKSKAAYTQVKTLARFPDSTYLEVKPRTGRMHQIRAHLKFLGFPIIGDKKYGIKDDYQELFLHAYKIGFHHPQNKKYLEFASALPEHFKKFIKEKRKNA
jgi:23S rRNA pseudouridine1911/1915/1917 synthase